MTGDHASVFARMRVFILNLVIKLVIPALLALLLFGVVGRREAIVVVAAIVLWRMAALTGEWMRPSLTQADWDRQAAEWMDIYRRELDRRGTGEEGSTAESPGSPAALAAARVTELQSHYKRPRPSKILTADAIGVVSFLLLLPFFLTLKGHDFVSWRGGYTFTDLLIFGACLLLYALPLLPWTRRVPHSVLWLWWCGPLFYLIPASIDLISLKHPYLNPWNPERTRLHAERLLATRDGVTISSEAHLLVDYAEEMAARGESQKAVELCQYAVRMSPGHPQGLALLRKLNASLPESEPAEPLHKPYFDPGTPIPKAPRTLVGLELEQIERCTTVLVPMGEISGETLDFVAAVITQQTGMPVLVYDRVLRLPEHTRTRGLAVGKQWDTEVLVKVLQAEFERPMPSAPLRYILITTADMYAGDANFLFANTFPWGAVVSSARFAEGADAAAVRHRLAKQSLSVLMKSFGVIQSADRRCVTSYPASLDEFDAKGNRPLPAVRREFEALLEKVNAEWRRLRLNRNPPH